MTVQKRAALGVGTFALGMFMGLSTGMAGAANGPSGYEGQPGHQAGGGSKVCSPGQHGNPAPGFKPASCKR